MLATLSVSVHKFEYKTICVWCKEKSAPRYGDGKVENIEPSGVFYIVQTTLTSLTWRPPLHRPCC